MQELALEAELLRPAVHRIACDREVDRRQMDADLVGAARLEPDVSEAHGRGKSSTTVKCVTASRGESVSSECRIASRRSRPIGASIRPLPRARPATTSAK